MNARPTRRAVSTGILVGLVGCLDESNGDDSDDDDREGDDERNDDNPAFSDATQDGELRLTSPAFDDGAEIPPEYGYDETNVNPPLEIDAVPGDADSLALVVDDPDAVEPSGQIWVHWLVWNVPPETTSIPEGWDPDDAVEGTNDFDEIGYGGPRPPDEEHTYRFKLYALESVLDLEAGATVDDLGAAMDGRVLAQTQLTGTYAP